MRLRFPFAFAMFCLFVPPLSAAQEGGYERPDVGVEALPPLQTQEVGASPGSADFGAADAADAEDADESFEGGMQGEAYRPPQPSPAPNVPPATMDEPAAAEIGEKSDPEQLIERARQTVSDLMADEDYPLLRDVLSRSKAVLIAPNVIRLGFFLGGRGGAAVLVARDNAGNWSAPAFYTLGGPSFGFQIGAQSSEIMLCIVSEKGLRAIMNSKFTIGADAGVAVFDMGAGAQAATGLDANADMYAFARSDGLFVGISLDGTVITPKESYNHMLYGPQATPEAILLQRSYSAPQAAKLLSALP